MTWELQQHMHEWIAPSIYKHIEDMNEEEKISFLCEVKAAQATLKETIRIEKEEEDNIGNEANYVAMPYDQYLAHLAKIENEITKETKADIEKGLTEFIINEIILPNFY